ncbi:MAG TPA: YaiO family outer membrane beta-barrel protein [Vicinamibacteria bacterium]|nr:YaiO family outer membrane beta-barrel protein [Vicinamibacteria bacterium]
MIAGLLLAAALASPQLAQTEREAATRLARSGHHAEALRRFQALASADPRDLEARIWVARLHNWLHHYAQAEQAFRGVLAEAPDNVEALVGLGTSLAARARMDEGLELLERAERLAPDDADVLAALGRAHRFAGHTSLALGYYRRAEQLSPQDADIHEGLEHTERLHAHRLIVNVFDESFSRPSPASRSGAIELDYRLRDDLRVLTRAQTQRKFDETDARAGGGLEWRADPRTTLSGLLLIGPGAEVLPRVDASAEADLYRGDWEPTARIRYFTFATARVWLLSPAVTFRREDRAIGVHYHRSFTSFSGRRGWVGDNALALRGSLRVQRRVWLDAGYAHGVDSFETLTVERLGRFRADTVAAGGRIDFGALTSAGLVYERQWRDDHSRMGRLSLSLVQRFR